MADEKCGNCGGEGLIHQGESIKFTCSVCMGSGKAVESYGEVSGSEEVAAVDSPEVSASVE